MKVAYPLALALLLGLSTCADYEKPPPVDRSLAEPILLERVEGAYRLTSELNDPVVLDAAGQRISVNGGLLSRQPSNAYEIFRVANGRDTVFLGERNLAVEGVPNLRDVGGLVNAQGYQVKWGKVFRSGKLAEVDEAEFDRLRSLGLKTIVDFRTTAEKEEDPDRWPDIENINQVAARIGDEEMMDNFMAELKKEDFDATAMMARANRDFVRNHAAEYKVFFELLLDEANHPLLFHCSAGKDRAGFGSYLLLTALGVEADKRLEEYLLSNYYLQNTSEADIKKAAQFYGLDQDKLRELMNVKPEYIQGGLDAIEEEYGSVENFLCEALAVCAPEIDRLRQLMLYDYKSTYSSSYDSLGVELPANATGYSVDPVLEGAPNFRAFNVSAGDELTMRPNRIFRSDALHELTATDLRKLENLGVRTVIDFRHQLELDEDPDRLPRTVKNYLNPAITRNPDDAASIMDSTQYVALRRGFLEGRYVEVDSIIRGLDIDLDARRLDRYASFALDYTDSYGDFLRALAEPDDYPVVYHCQGGKDRAGFASAILLKTLGFDDQQIVNDFLTTNLHAYDQQQVYYRSGVRSLSPVLSAHSAHLMHAMRTIEQEYGSFSAYLEEGLGLSAKEIEAVRKNLLLG